MKTHAAFALALFLAAAGAPAAAQNLAAHFIPTPSTYQFGYLTVAHQADLTPANGVTAEAWIYPTTGNGGGVIRMNIDTGGYDISYDLRIQTGKVEFYVNPASGPTVSVQTPGYSYVPGGQWTHIAATYDNIAARIYVNGAFVISLAVAGGPLTTSPVGDLVIGNANTLTFDGSIDCARVWSYARSAAEIQATMGWQFEDLPGLVASWNFDGDYQDSTGSHHAVPVNTVPLAAPGAPITPFLTAPSLLTVGGQISYGINQPVGSKPYILDVSLAGTSPGVDVLGGPHIPLNPPYLNSSTGGVYTNYFVGFVGFLDAAGHAAASVNVPVVQSLAGFTLSATYVVLDPLAPAGIAYVAPPVGTLLGGLPVTVTGVVPPSGPMAGGAPITISGTNFHVGASVKIGPNSATNVTVVNGGTITCVTPPGTAGSQTVTVEHVDLTSAQLANGYAYEVPLFVTQVTPKSAPPAAPVTVAASGVSPGVTVSVGGIAVTPTSVTPTQVMFLNPAGVPCNATIMLTNPSGAFSSIGFNPQPVVTNVLSGTGSAAGGGAFALSGFDFVPGSTITVAGAPAAISILGPTYVLATAPPGTPGPAAIVLTSPGGCSALGAYLYQ